MPNGTGIYFDGKTSARHDVRVDAASDALQILTAEGAIIAVWAYGELRASTERADLMRLRRAENHDPARLEIRDPILIAFIDERAHGLDRTGTTERRQHRRVILWSVAATISLVLIAVVGVPALSDRLAPLIPLSVEQRLGVAVDSQVRSMLDKGRSSDRPFECGTTDAEKPGRTAMDLLLNRLQTAAQLPIPLKAATVRRSEANAIALPGGHVYIFEGLIRQARDPDELAGVIAHEIGHVAHRDGTRSLLQAAGLSFLFGMLLGDFTGGGLVVIAARTVVETAYSREAESDADQYAVTLMGKAGGNPRALGELLARIASPNESTAAALRNHPQTKDRIAAMNAAASALPKSERPLLSAPEWNALKRICG
jgi:Zn-dependent protease with chaperone function